MKSKKLMRMLIIGASIFALAGCGTSNENDITNPDKKDAPNENDSNNTPDGNDSSAVGRTDGDKIIAASDLQGSVTEFSDNGCTITPVTSSNDGKAKIAEEAADGWARTRTAGTGQMRRGYFVYLRAIWRGASEPGAGQPPSVRWRVDPNKF